MWTWRATLLALAVLLSYAFVLRPGLLRWGSVTGEAEKPLPGDSLVPDAASGANRAITIQAPPERVWPWVAQIGQGRGGFYSYTWLENLVGCQIVNADRIHAEWQDIKPGDGIRLHPAMPPIPVALVEKNRALVLGGAGGPKEMPRVSWAFVLEPGATGSTRLLVRWRSAAQPSFGARLLYQYLLEPIHFIMERRMLLGIRERAEAEPSHRL